MRSGSSNHQLKQSTTVPPRRGMIKAQIFESFVERLTSLASKAGEALSKLRGVGDDGVRSPGSLTPPPSSYDSDESPRHS